ncbi:hypothetical protein O3S69_34425, partial [Streptomyces rubrogriseus]|nr:hypothetical protein [Streptomyces rubrogriseus]
ATPKSVTPGGADGAGPDTRTGRGGAPGARTARKGTPLRGTDMPQEVRRRGGIGAWARRLTGGRGGAPEAPAPGGFAPGGAAAEAEAGNTFVFRRPTAGRQDAPAPAAAQDEGTMTFRAVTPRTGPRPGGPGSSGPASSGPGPLPGSGSGSGSGPVPGAGAGAGPGFGAGKAAAAR